MARTMDYTNMWIEQCRAAEGIKKDYGLEKALGYLIGEKFLNFISASDSDPELEEELPSFAKEIKEIFQPYEIAEYFKTAKRVGIFGHTCSDEDYATFLKAGTVEENVVKSAEEIMLFERAKSMLLD